MIFILVGPIIPGVIMAHGNILALIYFPYFYAIGGIPALTAGILHGLMIGIIFAIQKRTRREIIVWGVVCGGIVGWAATFVFREGGN